MQHTMYMYIEQLCSTVTTGHNKLHIIYYILYHLQARLNVDLPSEIVSKINLVDLAGR